MISDRVFHFEASSLPVGLILKPLSPEVGKLSTWKAVLVHKDALKSLAAFLRHLPDAEIEECLDIFPTFQGNLLDFSRRPIGTLSWKELSNYLRGFRGDLKENPNFFKKQVVNGVETARFSGKVLPCS